MGLSSTVTSSYLSYVLRFIVDLFCQRGKCPRGKVSRRNLSSTRKSHRIWSNCRAPNFRLKVLEHPPAPICCAPDGVPLLSCMNDPLWFPVVECLASPRRRASSRFRARPTPLACAPKHSFPTTALIMKTGLLNYFIAYFLIFDSPNRKLTVYEALNLKAKNRIQTRRN